MLPFTINLAPLLLTLVTGFGILMHDTRVDRAFGSIPSIGYVASHDSALRNEDHTHTEKVTENLRNISTNQPRLQTRFTDEKKYLSPKRTYFNTTFDGIS